MKHVMVFATIGACLLVLSGGAALATDAHKVMGTKGQLGSRRSRCCMVRWHWSAWPRMQRSPPGQIGNGNTNSPFPTLATLHQLTLEPARENQAPTPRQLPVRQRLLPTSSAVARHRPTRGRVWHLVGIEPASAPVQAAVSPMAP